MAALRQVSEGAMLAEHGVAMLVALLMLIAVLLLGASAARVAILGEQAARAERDRYVAQQAAEDALADAEMEINGGAASSPARIALLASGSGLGFAPGCGLGADNPGLGLCAHAAGDAAPAWETVDIGEDGAASRSVPYGLFTGAAMETGKGLLPFRRPRYIIERVPYLPPGEDASSTHYFYRVTAIGFGARETTEVVLQGSYRKADTGGAP
jgi:type IV pilus assembly protein PilX